MEIFLGYKRKLFKDLFARIIYKLKDNVHNILLYWAKYFLIKNENEDDFSRMVSILINNIKSFITESSEEKYKFIKYKYRFIILNK